jgi:2-hydroxy-6-oxonona-2,4-dienedioate hydrolase
VTGRDEEDPPAIVRALAAQATRFETPCGDGTLAWRRWGEGPRELVMLHGGAGSWLHFLRNIPAFAQRFRVWVPDLPGMGESAAPPQPWTPASIASLLEEGLALQAGEAPVSVIGFSFGGMVAGHWAATHPGRIERIVVAAPAGTGLATPPTASMRSWRQLPDAAERRAIHRHNLRAWMLHDPESADDLAAWIAQSSVERDRLRNREVSTTDSLLRAMPNVSCPAHAIYGMEDVLYRDVQPQVREA